jgi:hypothetical protein
VMSLICAPYGAFICADCGKTFPKGRPDEEAWAEYRASGFPADDETAVVCDDCYTALMAAFEEWASANTGASA